MCENDALRMWLRKCHKPPFMLPPLPPPPPPPLGLNNVKWVCVFLPPPPAPPPPPRDPLSDMDDICVLNIRKYISPTTTTTANTQPVARNDISIGLNPPGEVSVTFLDEPSNTVESSILKEYIPMCSILRDIQSWLVIIDK